MNHELEAIKNWGINHNAQVRQAIKEKQLPTAEQLIKAIEAEDISPTTPITPIMPIQEQT